MMELLEQGIATLELETESSLTASMTLYETIVVFTALMQTEELTDSPELCWIVGNGSRQGYARDILNYRISDKECVL